MEIQSSTCQFCGNDPIRFIGENDLAYTFHDGYPVTGLHALICGFRDLSSTEETLKTVVRDSWNGTLRTLSKLRWTAGIDQSANNYGKILL
jgi:diadenosine tetraphosphate (Ap4A) HIT family hydrolase